MRISVQTQSEQAFSSYRVVRFGLHGPVRDPQIRLITHHHPDVDAFVSLYFYWREKCHGRRVQFCLVMPEQMLEPIPGCIDIYLDCGDERMADGRWVFVFNHHKTHSKSVCTATLVAEALGISKKNGARPLASMALARDHVEVRKATDLSMVIPGMYGAFTQGQKIDMPGLTREIFSLLALLYRYWGAHHDQPVPDMTDVSVLFMAIEEFVDNEGERAEKIARVQSILQHQEQRRSENLEIFNRKKEQWTKTLENGLVVALLQKRSHLLGAALAAGCDVALISTVVGERNWYGIQLNRSQHGRFTLGEVYEALRKGEGKLRESASNKANFWYLHPSGNLVLCGSKACPLEGEDISAMGWEEFCQTAVSKFAELVLA